MFLKGIHDNCPTPVAAEADSKSSGTSKMELFVKIVNGCQLLTIFIKNSILDHRQILLLILSEFK